MSEQVTIRATVRALDGNFAEVEVEQGCGRCHEEGGCGGQNLTQMFCGGPKRYRVDNPVGAVVGDKVRVAIAAGTIRRTANRAYGWPLLGMLAGALVGNLLFADAGAISGAVLGTVAAFFWQRRAAPLESTASQPYIVSRIEHSKEVSRS